MSQIAETEKKKVRLATPDFIVILCISFFSFCFVQCLNNGTPLYIDSFGGKTGFSGMLALEFAACAGVTRIVAGRIIDRSSRRPILFIGAFIMLAGSAGALLFTGVYPQIVMRALQGIGFALATTTASTAAAEVLPYERLGEGISYYTLGQSIGMAIGPAAAIYLSSMHYNESLFLGVTCIAVALIICVTVCRYEKHPEKLPESSAYYMRAQKGDLPGQNKQQKTEDGKKIPLVQQLFERRALTGALPLLVACMGLAIPTTFTALFAELRGIENAGLFFFIGAIVMTLLRLFGGKLIDFLRPITLYTLPMACGIIMFAFMNFAKTPILFYCGGIFFGVAMGMALPILNSVVMKITPSNRWGAGNATFYLANDLGVGIGALLWGNVADAAGFGVVMIGGICCMVLSYLVALISMRKVK